MYGCTCLERGVEDGGDVLGAAELDLRYHLRQLCKGLALCVDVCEFDCCIGWIGWIHT